MSEVKIAPIPDLGQRTDEITIYAGPCSVESAEQFEEVAECVADLGLHWIRGGAFKPRTNPHSFQGLGEEALKIMKAAGDKYNLKTLTEVMDSAHCQLVSDYVDGLQVGARNFQNFSLLKKIGQVTADTHQMVPDGYQDGYDETDNTAFGGVIGAVVGLLGGPVGVLLGAGIGLVAGMAMDDKDIDDDDSLMEYCASELTPGATALVMLAKEDREDALDAQFDETCIIYRWDADEVNAEVERGEALRDSLAAETRKQLREARKEARKARREARKDK